MTAARVTLSQALCLGCGKPLEGRRIHAATCSSACRQRAYRRRRTERKQAPTPEQIDRRARALDLSYVTKELGRDRIGPFMALWIRECELPAFRGFGISEPMRKKARRLERFKLESERAPLLPDPPIVATRSQNGNGNGHRELTPELRRELKAEIDRRRRPLARAAYLAERAVEAERKALEREERAAA